MYAVKKEVLRRYVYLRFGGCTFKLCERKESATAMRTPKAFVPLAIIDTGWIARFTFDGIVLSVLDRGYGWGGAPIFTGVFEPLARVALYPTDKDGSGTCFGAA